MAKKNFYAVKKGKNTGIFNTWNDCKESVTGFSGAEYQGFTTLEEAEEYLGISRKLIKKAEKTINEKTIKKAKSSKNTKGTIKSIRSTAEVKTFDKYIDVEEIKDKYNIIAFVDGSYDKHTKIYGGGAVIVNYDKNETECFKCAGYDKWDQWNIVGELESVKMILKIAKEKLNAKNIAIYHDLKNISLWASGEWQAKNEYTQDYVRFIEEYSKDIDITFIKVKGHSDESIYNDLADETAKKAIDEYLLDNNNHIK